MIGKTSSLIGEKLLSLNQAARKLPPGRRDRPVSLSCVLRWVLDGAPAPDGSRVKLEAVRLGGRWLTSIEALGRFADALTPRQSKPIPKGRTPKQRERGTEGAKKILAKIGI
jgi:hypothetical protein